jgi:hypothetical protein
MTYDPEQIREERRAMPRPERPRGDANESPPAGPSEAELRTLQLLAKLREGSPMANAERWLCVIRGDRKPATPAELDAAIADLAADEQQSVETVRAGIDAKLQAEGSSLAAWIARLNRPRKLLGRGLTSPSSTTSTRGVAC